jgi:hypothetical protein
MNFSLYARSSVPSIVSGFTRRSTSYGAIRSQAPVHEHRIARFSRRLPIYITRLASAVPLRYDMARSPAPLAANTCYTSVTIANLLSPPFGTIHDLLWLI